MRCEITNAVYLIVAAWKTEWKNVSNIVIDQLPRSVCSIEAQIPRAKPEGRALLYCIQSEGLVNNY